MSDPSQNEPDVFADDEMTDDRLREWQLRQRCVDGELSAVQLREYVNSLSDHTESWRQLALAFVEQQLVSQSVRDWSQTLDEVSSSSEESTTATAAQSANGTRRIRMLPAVSLLACLGWIGVGLLGWELSRQAVRRDDGSSASLSSAVQANPENQPEQITPISHSAGRAQADADPVMQLIVSADELGTEVEIPVFDPPSTSEWIESGRPVVQEHLKSALYESGYSITQHRSYITLQLDDGRQIAVPRDTLHFARVGL